MVEEKKEFKLKIGNKTKLCTARRSDRNLEIWTLEELREYIKKEYILERQRKKWPNLRSKQEICNYLADPRNMSAKQIKQIKENIDKELKKSKDLLMKNVEWNLKGIGFQFDYLIGPDHVYLLTKNDKMFILCDDHVHVHRYLEPDEDFCGEIDNKSSKGTTTQLILALAEYLAPRRNSKGQCVDVFLEAPPRKFQERYGAPGTLTDTIYNLVKYTGFNYVDQHYNPETDTKKRGLRHDTKHWTLDPLNLRVHLIDKRDSRYHQSFIRPSFQNYSSIDLVELMKETFNILNYLFSKHFHPLDETTEELKRLKKIANIFGTNFMEKYAKEIEDPAYRTNTPKFREEQKRIFDLIATTTDNLWEENKKNTKKKEEKKSIYVRLPLQTMEMTEAIKNLKFSPELKNKLELYSEVMHDRLRTRMPERPVNLPLAIAYFVYIAENIVEDLDKRPNKKSRSENIEDTIEKEKLQFINHPNRVKLTILSRYIIGTIVMLKTLLIDPYAYNRMIKEFDTKQIGRCKDTPHVRVGIAVAGDAHILAYRNWLIEDGWKLIAMADPVIGKARCIDFQQMAALIDEHLRLYGGRLNRGPIRPSLSKKEVKKRQEMLQLQLLEEEMEQDKYLGMKNRPKEQEEMRKQDIYTYYDDELDEDYDNARDEAFSEEEEEEEE